MAVAQDCLTPENLSLTVSSIRRATREQDIVRLLFLLDRAGEDPLPAAPPHAVSCMIGQMRLQALDFWLRNPDYLANELLTEYEDGRMGSEAIDRAERMLDEREPVIRRFPMTRWHYGAYEPLDNALAMLSYPELIHIEVDRTAERVRRHIYYLLAQGRSFAEELLAGGDEFTWYAERSTLIGDLAAGTGGARLKDRQYQVDEYGATKRGAVIASIEADVRQRLLALRAGVS